MSKEVTFTMNWKPNFKPLCRRWSTKREYLDVPLASAVSAYRITKDNEMPTPGQIQETVVTWECIDRVNHYPYRGEDAAIECLTEFWETLTQDYGIQIGVPITFQYDDDKCEWSCWRMVHLDDWNNRLPDECVEEF